MADISKHQIGSINDITIYINSVKDKFGARIVNYDLPQSSRYLSFNGVLEDDFTIEAEIEDEKFSILRAILKTEKSFFVTFPAIYDGGAFINEEVFLTEAFEGTIYDKSYRGLIKFTIRVSKYPLNIKNKYTPPSTVQDMINRKRQVTESNLTRLTKTFKSTTRTITDAKKQIYTLTARLQNAVNTIIAVPNIITDFQIAIQNLQYTIDAAIAIPDQLTIKVANILGNFSIIANNADDQYKAIKSVLDTNYIEVITKPGTIYREINAVNVPIQKAIFTEMINNITVESVLRNYDTKEDVLATRNYINNQLQANLRHIDDSNIILDLQNQVTSANLILNKIAADLDNVKDYNFSLLSPYAASYMIYGVLDYADNLVSRNKIKDNTFINGKIKAIIT